MVSVLFVLVILSNDPLPSLPSNLCYVAEGNLQLLTFLPSPPDCWNHGHAPPHLSDMVLTITPQASCIHCSHSTNRTTSPSVVLYYYFFSVLYLVLSYQLV